MAKLVDVSPAHYQRIISEGAAVLLVLLPPDISTLTKAQRETVWELEAVMLNTEVQAAVYFVYETEELLQIYESVQASVDTDSATSAAAALFSSLSSDGYQMVVGGSQSKLMSDMSIANIQGKLSGYGIEEQFSTVAIVAHYDAIAAAPELSWGADSNGSGVVMLLELARILSRLYSSPRTHPRINVLFLLSGGGSINYQGSKRFLEDQLDASDSPLLMEPHFALCLDTVANGKKLFLHVSKRPRENTPGHDFFTMLESVGSEFGIQLDMVHKKINLQEDKQSWEHEKYSMRRLPAFTLSRLEGPKSGERGTLTDAVKELNVSALTQHVSVVATTLLRHIYNSTLEDILKGGLAVTEESVSSWINMVTMQPRSPQLLTGKNNPFITLLYETLSRYTSETKVTWLKADKRDPEWAFYDVTKTTMTAYTVKPASFDFLLTLVIVAYLGIVYCFLQYFSPVYSFLARLAPPMKTKVN